MILINFAHPITSEHCQAIETLTGETIQQIREVPTQLDPLQPFPEQVRQLVDTVGLTGHEWQTTPLLVNLPTLSVAAALVLAELHGRCGYFPAVLRLRQSPDSLMPQFEVAEILNLQEMRYSARHQR